MAQSILCRFWSVNEWAQWHSQQEVGSMIIPKKNMGERTRHLWTINDVADASHSGETHR